MAQFKSDFLNVLSERGYLNQCTDYAALDEAATKGVVTGYQGFDATADSLHVGHLMGIMTLRRMQQTGHKVIVLMGGGTTKVGDPSDKTGMRQMLTDEIIDGNISRIKGVFSKYLTFGSGAREAIMVNNAEWLDQLGYIPFLREVGKHLTINRMITFDFVRRRLEHEQPLTFLEFNYMIMQGYDFVELYKRYSCSLQIGGSDQWGNIVNGVELGHKLVNTQLYGLTTNLLTTSSGAKMGKTANGAVWLNEDRLSSYDFWQFWRNTEDADVIRFLKLFTDLSLAEIAKLEKLQGAEINAAKVILANEVTKLCRGQAATEAAEATAKTTFEAGGLGDDLPIYALNSSSAAVVDIIVSLGFVASKGEAKRLIEQGGVRLNDQTVTSITATVSANDLDGSGAARLSAGKKRHAVVKAG